MVNYKTMVTPHIDNDFLTRKTIYNLLHRYSKSKLS